MSNYLLRAQKAKNNEFYTEYKTMEYLFESEEQGPQFCEFVKNKIIYLPCDTEDSNIYKYFVANKERLQIKEILRTSDDYYGHLDLYEKCDLVFTNPPFTGLYKYTKWLEYDLNKKFVLWWSWMSISFNDYIEFCNKKWKILTIMNELNLYSNLNQKAVNCFVFTNVDGVKCKTSPFNYKFNTKVEDLPTYNGIPYINNIRQFPITYNGQIYIPLTAFYGRVELFEFFDIQVIICEDNKLRPRALVKLKNPKYEKETN